MKDKDRRGDEILRRQKEQNTITEDHHLLPVERNDIGLLAGVGPKDSNSLKSTSDVLYNINDLLERRLRSDSQRRHEADKHQQMMKEWMIAAAVIDRVCFIIFSIIFVIGTAVLFVMATSK